MEGKERRCTDRVQERKRTKKSLSQGTISLTPHADDRRGHSGKSENPFKPSLLLKFRKTKFT